MYIQQACIQYNSKHQHKILCTPSSSYYTYNSPNLPVSSPTNIRRRTAKGGEKSRSLQVKSLSNMIHSPPYARRPDPVKEREFFYSVVWGVGQPTKRPSSMSNSVVRSCRSFALSCSDRTSSTSILGSWCKRRVVGVGEISPSRLYASSSLLLYVELSGLLFGSWAKSRFEAVWSSLARTRKLSLTQQPLLRGDCCSCCICVRGLQLN